MENESLHSPNRKSVVVILAVLIVSVLASVWYLSSNKDRTTGGDKVMAPVENKNLTEEKSVPTTDETSNWIVYQSKEYGFEIKYPMDVLSPVKSGGDDYGLILESFTKSHPEDSEVSDMQVVVEKIKDSASGDVKSELAKASASTEVAELDTKQIGGKTVFVTTYKLYGGGEGFSRSYYFPDFILTFAYANNEAEGRLSDTEQKMLATVKFGAN